MEEKQKKSSAKKISLNLKPEHAKRKLKTEPSKKDYLIMAQKIQADFENYKKRVQQEREEFAGFANTGLLLQILPIIDNFRLATKHLPEDLKNNNWAQGVLHIEKQLEQVVADEGITKIESTGKMFDSYLHEAVEEVESAEKEGIIIEEILKGYKLKDKVIRHAKVKVSKGTK